jgi:HlyD family secretion protein
MMDVSPSTILTTRAPRMRRATPPDIARASPQTPRQTVSKVSTDRYFGLRSSGPSFALAFLSLTIVIGIAGCDRIEKSGTPNQVASVTSSRVMAQGTLEPMAGVVAITAIPGDRVESIAVSRGAQVQKGDPLLVLASRQLRELELAIAKRRAAEGNRQREVERGAANQRVAAAKLQLQQAQLQQQHAQRGPSLTSLAQEKRDAALAAKTRAEKIAADPKTKMLIGRDELDRLSLAVRASEGELQQAQQQNGQADQMTALAVDVAQQAVDAAENALEAVDQSDAVSILEKQVDLVQLQHDQTTLRAPLTATVLDVQTRGGESTGPRPLMQLADLSSMVCVAEVHQADVTRVAVGQPAQLSAAALGEPLKGKVIEVAQWLGTPQLVDPNPMARADYRSVKVRIAIDQADVPRAAQRVQLQVDVEIQLQP